MEPIKDKYYTAKWMRENKVHPCTHCHKPHLCNSQCTWAYWSTGSRDTTLYKWDGTTKDGHPVYNDLTWQMIDPPPDNSVQKQELTIGDEVWVHASHPTVYTITGIERRPDGIEYKSIHKNGHEGLFFNAMMLGKTIFRTKQELLNSLK